MDIDRRELSNTAPKLIKMVPSMHQAGFIMVASTQKINIEIKQIYRSIFGKKVALAVDVWLEAWFFIWKRLRLE